MDGRDRCAHRQALQHFRAEWDRPAQGWARRDQAGLLHRHFPARDREALSVDALAAGRAQPQHGICYLGGLNQTLLRWIQSPETKERFFNSGADVWPTTPEELGQIVKADMAKWAKVIKERGIRASD